VGQQRIDLARIGQQIRAGHQPVAVLAINFQQQPLEFLKIAIDRQAEVGLAA
jgi:hypothetical protein